MREGDTTLGRYSGLRTCLEDREVVAGESFRILGPSTDPSINQPDLGAWLNPALGGDRLFGTVGISMKN